jgi:hypothetical protein
VESMFASNSSVWEELEAEDELGWRLCVDTEKGGSGRIDRKSEAFIGPRNMRASSSISSSVPKSSEATDSISSEPENAVTAACWNCNKDWPIDLAICRKGGRLSLHGLQASTLEGDGTKLDIGRHFILKSSSFSLPLSAKDVGEKNALAGMKSAPDGFLPVDGGRRMTSDWILIRLLPGLRGFVAFVQRHSRRVMLTQISETSMDAAAAEAEREADLTHNDCKLTGDQLRRSTIESRLGLSCMVSGKVVALHGNMEQIRTLDIDTAGKILVAGDEGGRVCCWLLKCLQPSSRSGYDLTFSEMYLHMNLHSTRCKVAPLAAFDEVNNLQASNLLSQNQQWN